MAASMTQYKLVVLGDAGVGKTALTIKLCIDHFVEIYDPTVQDSYQKQVVLDGQPCVVNVLDTGGQERYNALRDKCIQDGEGFVLVYSVSSRSSFIWIEEFQKGLSAAVSAGLVPVMLVGNKSDSFTEREVSTQEGHALARKLGFEFVEASAKNGANVEKAFYDVVRLLRRQLQKSVQKVMGGTDTGRGNNADRKNHRRDSKKCIIL